MADGFMSSFTDNVDLGFGMGDFTSGFGDIGGSLSAFTDPVSGLAKSLDTAAISNTLSNIQSNISPSVGAMCDMIQR